MKPSEWCTWVREAASLFWEPVVAYRWWIIVAVVLIVAFAILS